MQAKPFLLGLLCAFGACSDPSLTTQNDDLGDVPGDLGLPSQDLPTEDILVSLGRLPGVMVTEKPTNIAGYRFFQLLFDQPADHQKPEGLRFQQRLTLLYRDRATPTIFLLSGYGSGTWDRPVRAEPTTLLNANQLEVEHRFFAPSIPSPADYDLLTIAQAAADHHRIVAAVRPLTIGRWVSTGTSKGGMTTVYHRRFYPDDVDASIPYVAPHSVMSPDQRYVPFVANAGPDPACRQSLARFQRLALSRRTEVLARMNAANYARLGPEKALEHCVLELPFGFWQYQGAALCGSIPADNAAFSAIYSFLNTVGQLGQYDDADTAYFAPYYYQSARQLGYPAIDESGVKDLLRYPGTDNPSDPGYLPMGARNPTYDPAAMADVGGWLKSAGQRMLFVYGEYDPWSAGAFDLGQAQDSFKFIAPAGNHGSKIRSLADADRQRALAALSRWTGVTLQTLTTGLRALVPSPGAPPEDEALDLAQTHGRRLHR